MFIERRFTPVPPAAGTVLVVDDEPANLRLLERVLGSLGLTVHTAPDGDEALRAVETRAPDVVVMDVRMPRRDGFTTCRDLKQNAATRLLPVVLMTGASEHEDRIRAIESGADDFLTKPIDQAELKARVRSLIRLKRYTDDLDSAEAVIFSLALTVEARDPHTEGHCERLAAHAVAFAQHLSLPEDDLAALYRGGFLHDLGKIATPDSILLKPGRLTPAEYEVMKQHSVIGERLCGNLRVLSRVRPIVRHHHERLDGGGYPDGLRGDDIPLLAQIISIVDVYDAMTSARPYRAAVTAEAALDELRREAKYGWRRRDLVDGFAAAWDAGVIARVPGV